MTETYDLVVLIFTLLATTTLVRCNIQETVTLSGAKIVITVVTALHRRRHDIGIDHTVTALHHRHQSGASHAMAVIALRHRHESCLNHARIHLVCNQMHQNCQTLTLLQ
jgi:hypothetical protein